jgi:hypothetical protein
LWQVGGNFNSLSDAYCSYYGLNNIGGISASMTQGLKDGMVLTMGLWGDLNNLLLPGHFISLSSPHGR